MKAFLCIFIGGGLGSAARYFSQLLINRNIAETTFPISTFVINLLGSFFIGLLFALATRFDFSHETRLLLIVGLCGGFTTFSSFSNENLSLLKNGFYSTFILYTSFSILLGAACTLVGIWMGKHLF